MPKNDTQNRKEINNKNDALSLHLVLLKMKRSSWIVKGSRKKTNENIEIPRELALELTDKALQYFVVLEQLPYDPTCHCDQVEELLQRAIQELPDGETSDMLQQLIFSRCPCCGQLFNKEGINNDNREI